MLAAKGTVVCMQHVARLVQVFSDNSYRASVPLALFKFQGEEHVRVLSLQLEH